MITVSCTHFHRLPYYSCEVNLFTRVGCRGSRSVTWNFTHASQQASWKITNTITGCILTFDATSDAHETKAGSQEKRSFLWQHYAFPFAYPSFYFEENKKTRELEEIVRYKPSITRGLMDGTKDGRLIKTVRKPAPHKIVETPI